MAKFQLSFKRAATAEGAKLGKKPEAVLRDIFMQHDMDGNGRLDPVEFRRAASSIEGVQLSVAEAADVLKYYDQDHRGTISYEELASEAKNRAIVHTARKNIITHVKSENKKKGVPPGFFSSTGSAPAISARRSGRAAKLKAGAAGDADGPIQNTARQMLQVKKLRMENDLLKLKIQMRKLQLSS